MSSQEIEEDGVLVDLLGIDGDDSIPHPDEDRATHRHEEDIHHRHLLREDDDATTVLRENKIRHDDKKHPHLDDANKDGETRLHLLHEDAEQILLQNEMQGPLLLNQTPPHRPLPERQLRDSLHLEDETRLLPEEETLEGKNLLVNLHLEENAMKYPKRNVTLKTEKARILLTVILHRLPKNEQKRRPKDAMPKERAQVLHPLKESPQALPGRGQ